MLEGNRELGFILFSRTCKFIHLPLKERGHIYTWLRDIVKYFFFFFNLEITKRQVPYMLKNFQRGDYWNPILEVILLSLNKLQNTFWTA